MKRVWFCSILVLTFLPIESSITFVSFGPCFFFFFGLVNNFLVSLIKEVNNALHLLTQLWGLKKKKEMIAEKENLAKWKTLMAEWLTLLLECKFSLVELLERSWYVTNENVVVVKVTWTVGLPALKTFDS